MKWEAEIATIANGKIITWPRLSRVSCFLFLFHIYTAPHLCSPQTQEWFCMAGFHILILWDEASENLRFVLEWAANRNTKYSNYVGYSECLGWQVKLHRHFQMFTTEAVTEIMTKISTPRNRLSQQTIKWHEEVSLPTYPRSHSVPAKRVKFLYPILRLSTLRLWFSVQFFLPSN